MQPAEIRSPLSSDITSLPSAALRVRDLHFHYGTHRILRNISFDLGDGRTMALLGDNGAGKTTLLRCLCGLVPMQRGVVEAAGANITSPNFDKRAIGFAAHHRGLYLDLTARENLELAARLHGLHSPQQLALQTLIENGFERRKDETVRRLSQGLQQRLALLRAFLHEPRIRLLDEPFTHLDETNRRWLAEKMMQWRAAGVATLFTTHDPHMASALSDCLGRIVEGRLHVTSATADAQPSAGTDGMLLQRAVDEPAVAVYAADSHGRRRAA
ncbi:MAG: ATP-binding cassette domain-containing protein [Pirellulales bacterium]